MMWKTEFEGHLGRDLEMKYLADGMAVTSFSVAVNWPEKGAAKTEWIRCSAWRGLAEKTNEELNKGDLVRIRGTIRTRKWQRENGETEKSVEVSVSGYEKVFFENPELNARETEN